MVTGAIGFGATRAFFSDTETSTANAFTAGAIDLTVDNESYYNGVFNEDTSWEAVDLTIERFFEFLDVKPNDYGEDTISLHVATNDAYMCANIELTSNDENGCTEPEGLVDDSCNDPGPDEGELTQLVNFIWWADDGDNVLEDDEADTVFYESVADDLANIVVLADSDENVWTGTGGPMPGNETLYIAKAWCFGDIAATPIEQDGESDAMSPADDNDTNGTAGEPADGGFTCDGSALGNESQTDSFTADIAFQAYQARNNDDFQCEECEINTEETLIPDSGFEVPEVDTPQDWDIFDSPAGAWSVEWRGDIPATFGPQNRPDLAHLEIHEGVLGDAFTGDQYAELDSDWGGPSDSGTGEPASVSIYQDIPTTPGTTYQITFAFAPRPNTGAADNHLEVQWDGAVVYDSGPVGDPNAGIEWQEIDVTVEATSNLTELRFTDLGTANSSGTFVDAIRLYSEQCVAPGAD